MTNVEMHWFKRRDGCWSVRVDGRFYHHTNTTVLAEAIYELALVFSYINKMPDTKDEKELIEHWKDAWPESKVTDPNPEETKTP